MPAVDYTFDTCILVLDIVIEGEVVQVGALVDSVQAVLEFEDKEIQPPPSIGSKYKSEFITGIVRKDERFIMIMDVVKIFSIEDIVILKTVNGGNKGQAKTVNEGNKGQTKTVNEGNEDQTKTEKAGK